MSFRRERIKNSPILNRIRTRTTKEAALYLCKADIFLPRAEIPSTRKHLAKILSHVDPGWKFIRFRNDEISPLAVKHDRLNTSEIENSEETSIQALSVVLFIDEALYEEVLGTIQNEADIWQLRHSIKLLNNVDDSTVIGCMDFYEFSKHLPLWAISPIHFGNKILRFNIFVKDFEKMREYYERLISQQCNFVRTGFCIFNVHSYPGLDVQISLKKELYAHLHLTRSAVLRLKFRKLDVARCNLVSSLVQINLRVWRTKDPEGNVILLEEIGNESPDKLSKHRSKSEVANDELVFV
ncbi:protein FAM124A-like [Dendronephthya gigantea]|uniref:protein FAM124A-like n=1 Tax=Dendronephthya gigantea TaxID=151771 RepID=UPI00106958AE|nr:protein FAM124A-like [Dendronephthya gigantea]